MQQFLRLKPAERFYDAPPSWPSLFMGNKIEILPAQVREKVSLRLGDKSPGQKFPCSLRAL
jgi:hypothetical protein